MSFKPKYLLLSLLFSVSFLRGQEPGIRFENLNKEDGLSHTLVNAIVQDGLGYIWISTQDGINRYDGYEFKVFRPSPEPNTVHHQWATTLYKDSRGKIWIRYNKAGLSCYDPYTERFRNYLHEPDNPRTVSSNFASSRTQAKQQLIHEDKEGRLWIATEKGLNRYHSDTDDFERIYFEGLGSPALRQPPAIALTSGAQGSLLVGTPYGLIRYHPASGKAEMLLRLREESGDFVTSIHQDRQGVIWAGTRQNGLFKIRDGGGAKGLETINYISELRNSPEVEVAAFTMLEDRTGNLWLGVTDGLYVLKMNGREERDHFTRLSDVETGGREITFLHQDVHGKVWAASSSRNTLWSIDTASLNTRSFRHNPFDENSLGPNDINCIFEDRQGVLWFGHEKGGVTRANLFNKKFIHLNNSKPATSALPNNDVYAIYIDEGENLWIGTYNGLFRKDGATGAQKVYHPEPHHFGTNFTYSDKPGGKLVGTMAPAGDGALWLGFFDYKISRFDPKTGRFQNFQHVPGKEDAFKIWSMRDICVASDGSTYFAGTNYGLCKLQPDGQHFTYYFHDENDPNSISDEWLYTVIEDSEGILWIGTNNGGLNRFDPRMETFIAFKHEPGSPSSIPGNTVKCILEQQTPQGGRLWVGTENGLGRFDRQAGTFHNYYSRDGLPSNIIHGILEDGRGRLWISTNGGLSCFDPGTEQFTNYTQEDGLQDNEFNEGSYFKDEKGWLYFGGVNGATAFHPDSLSPNPYMPSLVITELRVNNEIVRPGDTLGGRVLLNRTIGDTDKITLTPHDKVISFSFAAFHFAAPSKIRYRYKLEPFETEWTEVGSNKRFINYTNIPPGDYRLHLECTSIDGGWGADSRVLVMEVLPPFWKTAWFKLLLLSLILLAIFTAIHIRTRVLAHQKRMLTREVRVRTLELERKSSQLEQANQKLKGRQEKIIEQNKKIAEQRDNLESRNQALEEQKQEIQRMAELLHQSDQSKLNFFTNISHEFRTPLSLIIGQTEGLLDQAAYRDTGQVKKNLNLMYRNEKRLFRLINQLLEIRRVESGNLQLEPRHRDVIGFSRELLALFEPLAARQGILLDFRPAQDELYMDFDPDKLEKILFNLLSNAFKHTSTGGMVMLEMNRRGSQETVALRVVNSGEGIKEEDLPYIFDRFFHASDRNHNGELSTGIGLSLVKDLVELHQGEINVELTEEGTCFQVCLPVRQTEKQRASLNGKDLERQYFDFARSMMEEMQETEAPSTSPKAVAGVVHNEDTPIVLVVEDNPDMRQLLSGGLQHDYKVLTAEDGKDGVEKAFEHIPDLIISDVMMPETDGLELTRILKNDPRTSHIPVLLLTAKAEVADQIAGLESGADDYLAKPFNLKALNLKLKNMLETRQALINSIRDSVPAIPENVNVKAIDHGLLSRIIEVIEQHIDDTTLNGDQLAREVGMSKGNLYRKLKAISGMTVNIFIRTIRLKVAAQLLQKGNYNIAEVAYSVGFDNPKYFSVCFKEIFSQTPREFMNAHAKAKGLNG